MASDEIYEQKMPLLKQAILGLRPGTSEFYEANGIPSKKFGIKTWEERNVFERLFDNFSAAAGLQDPRDLKAHKAQSELDAIYTPIFAGVQKDPSLQTYLQALGQLAPPQMPTAQPLQASPESLAVPGNPLPPPTFTSSIQAEGPAFSEAILNGTTQEYLAQKQRGTEPTPPSTLGPPMMGAPGIKAAPPEMLLNGAPMPGGQQQLAALNEIRAPVQALTGMHAQMPVNIENVERTGIGPPATIDRMLTLRAQANEHALNRASTANEKQLDRDAKTTEAQLKREAAELAARSPMGQLMGDRDKLNPDSLTYDKDVARIEKALDLKSEEHAKAIGTPTYQQKLMELGVKPGTESKAMSKMARLGVQEDVNNAMRYEQAVKAGDELAQQIAMEIGANHPEIYGKKTTFLSDLTTDHKREAGIEWTRRRRESQPMMPESAGRVAMMTTAIQELKNVRKMLFKADGTMDRTLLGQAAFPGGGLWFTKGRQFKATVRDMIGAKYRIETGAAGNQGEIDDLAVRFTPVLGDSDATGLDKVDRLDLFMGSALNLTDPGWVFRERAGMPKPDVGARYGELRNSGKSEKDAKRILQDEGYKDVK